MLRRSLVLLLLWAVFCQSCWALGEVLHSHGDSADSPLAPLFVDPHLEGDHDADHAPAQTTDTGHEHHHGCSTHNLCAIPAHAALSAPFTHVFSCSDYRARGPDAPADPIDRPNWWHPA